MKDETSALLQKVSDDNSSLSGPIYVPTIAGLTKKQWTIFIASWTGWGLDVFDALLFNYVANNCIPTLLGIPIGSPEAYQQTIFWTGVISSLLLVGWGIGGLLFGYLADIIGRKTTMQLTMFLFAIATGLCAVSMNIWMLIIFRFFAALGIGGEWAAGALMVAESVPENKRVVLGVVLYTSAPFGLLLASVVNFIIAGVLMPTYPQYSWRIIFLFGLIPAILASFIRFFIDESQKWIAHRTSSVSLLRTSYQSLDPASNNNNNNNNNNNKSYTSEEGKIRTKDDEEIIILEKKHSCPPMVVDANENKLALLFISKYIKRTMSGLIPAVIATLVWWSVNSFTAIIAAGLATERAEINDKNPDLYTESWKLIATSCYNIGGLLGTLCTFPIAVLLGRRFLFFSYFLGASFFILFSFTTAMDVQYSPLNLYLYFPIGFFVFGIFGAFTFYLPELFPTSLRGTGSGFCYNIGRFLAAGGPLLIGYISSTEASPYHTAIKVMFWVGLFPILGVLTAPFYVETKDKYLLA